MRWPSTGGIKPREKLRDSRGICFELETKMCPEMRLFAANRGVIEHHEVGRDRHPGPKGVPRHDETCGEQSAPQIQRVPGARVRATGGKLLILTKISRR